MQGMSHRDQFAAALKRAGDRHGALGYNLRYWGPVADDILAEYHVRPISPSSQETADREPVAEARAMANALLASTGSREKASWALFELSDEIATLAQRMASEDGQS
ncbi:hypothetical protein ACFO5K_04315 [Nocardia halotolerans]|uniref:Uncharacterized protein n=1 Tax=Nocardia halotolerans TaxID=1755878 RepID=A0ABV8VBN0_9NOCA